MSAFPNSPRLIKGGIVRVDPDSGAVQKLTCCNTIATRLRARCSHRALRTAATDQAVWASRMRTKAQVERSLQYMPGVFITYIKKASVTGDVLASANKANQVSFIQTT